jgi:hypothetical protein
MSRRQEKQLVTSSEDDRRNFESKIIDGGVAGGRIAFFFLSLRLCFEPESIFFCTCGGDGSSENGATGNK